VFVVQPATAPSRDSSFGRLFSALLGNVERVIQGKREQVHLALVCLLAEGHLLIEDVPGVGKTSLAKAIAASIGGTCHRIQFTPDLLPSDVTGVSVWNRTANEFEFRPGGIFANVVLADEINRASPKTQSALLEAMEERQVTVDAQTYLLPRPFLVIATQNPVEFEGTYALPQAQLDRFMVRVSLGYPSAADESAMLADHARGDRVLELMAVSTVAEVVAAQTSMTTIHASEPLRRYVVGVVDETRRDRRTELGASPRAGLMLLRAATARAALESRDHVLPDDVQELARAVLCHRLMLAPGVSDSERPAIVADALAAVCAL
jgi:MoxR-like ATPase